MAVTRARAEAAEFCTGLEALGAEVLVAPLIRIVPTPDPEPLAAAARQVEGYDWLVFTSVNGVEEFGAALAVVGRSISALAGVRVACIGPATAAAAVRWGWRPELIPESAVAESLLAALLRELGCSGAERAGGGGGAAEGAAESRCSGGAGVRVLLPVAAGARSIIERGLAECGVVVDRVEAYRTVGDPTGLELLLRRLHAGLVDVLTFASPSAVNCFADAGAGGLVRGVVVAVIGPVTAAAARRRGLEVGVEAAEHTMAGLLRSLVEYYR